MFKKGPGIPVYASDGVEDPPTARGTVAFRTRVPKPRRKDRIDHLNPQTIDTPMAADDDDDRDDDD